VPDPWVRCGRVNTTAGSEAAFVFPARRGRIRLAITPARIVATSAMGKVELPWKDLRSVEIAPLPGGRPGIAVLGLTATRPGAAVWTRGGWLGRLNRRTTPYEVSFKAAAFADEGEAVLRAIKRYQGDARRRRSIGSDDELARLLRKVGETPARA
jgi:hypothetical protein